MPFMWGTICGEGLVLVDMIWGHGGLEDGGGGGSALFALLGPSLRPLRIRGGRWRVVRAML